MTQNQSINKSSIRILKLLLNKSLTREEIIKILEIKPVTFFKNISLLIDAGFHLEKQERKYKIASFSNIAQYSHLNLDMMAHILTLASNLLSKNKVKILLHIMRKLLFLGDEKSWEYFYEKLDFFNEIDCSNKYEELLELFETYKENKMQIFVTTDDLIEYCLEPVEYFLRGKSLIFLFNNCYCEKRIELDAEKIKKIVPANKRIKHDVTRNSTIFELTGRLAKTYLLKGEEILKESKNNRMVVINYDTDKKNLFKRLLRYQSLCEIILSAEDRKEFKKLIEKSLDNIERFQDNNIK